MCSIVDFEVRLKLIHSVSDKNSPRKLSSPGFISTFDY